MIAVSAPVWPVGTTVARIATAAFLAGYFIYTAELPGREIVLHTALPELLVLGGLTIHVLLSPHGDADRRGLARTWGVVSVLVGGSAVYLIRMGTPRWGTLPAYANSAGRYIALYGLVTAFVCLFYNERTFVQLFWWASRVSLIVGFTGLRRHRLSRRPDS